jgi:hypothetical protein
VAVCVPLRIRGRVALLKKTIETYKGEEIKLELETGKFSSDDVVGEFDTLADVRAAVRKARAGVDKMPRINVVFVDGRYGQNEKISAGKTTGLLVGWNKSQVWVKSPNGGRQMISAADVYLDTEQNRMDLQAVLRWRTKIEEIEETVHGILTESMESLDTYLERNGREEDLAVAADEKGAAGDE